MLCFSPLSDNYSFCIAVSFVNYIMWVLNTPEFLYVPATDITLSGYFLPELLYIYSITTTWSRDYMGVMNIIKIMDTINITYSNNNNINIIINNNNDSEKLLQRCLTQVSLFDEGEILLLFLYRDW